MCSHFKDLLNKSGRVPKHIIFGLFAFKKSFSLLCLDILPHFLKGCCHLPKMIKQKNVTTVKCYMLLCHINTVTVYDSQ